MLILKRVKIHLFKDSPQFLLRTSPFTHGPMDEWTGFPGDVGLPKLHPDKLGKSDGLSGDHDEYTHFHIC